MAEKLKLKAKIEAEIEKIGSSEKAFLIYDLMCIDPEFMPFRKKFPEFYDKHFKAFIAKHSVESKFFTQREIKEMNEAYENNIRDRLFNNPASVKKSELTGYATVPARTEIVVEFLKHKNLKW